MIVYSVDVLDLLRDAGYSTYTIRKEKVFTEAQLQNLRNNRMLTQDALNKVCRILNCQPGDLIEYIPDDEQKKEAPRE